jgi:hypothetical protein
MFWCRMGGGVVPTQHVHGDPRSPRISEERKEEERKLSEEIERTGEIQPKDITPAPEMLSADAETLKPAQEEAAAPSPVSSPLREVESVDDIAEEAVADQAAETHDKTRDSTQSASSLKAISSNESEKEGTQRLSITIPGSFD